ncbi:MULTISPECIES: LPD1 domain-containing protein [unclassified Carboxylicivirga]|uniref:LPD1 domain-containing protein n=1 Tax=Carboxylicivirga TaxID=1628153 RepID=UPI003D339ABE
MTEKEFYKKYKAIHKDIRSNGKSKLSILTDGFKEGVNVNALPVYKGFEKETNIVRKRYNPRKGDFVWILTNEGFTEGRNGYRTKKGYKPNPDDGFFIISDDKTLYENYCANKIELIGDLGDIDQEVEIALRDKQKNRQFKDAGKRVHGSRKEQAMYNKLIRSSDLSSIEQDEATAIELIKKDKVFPKIEPQTEKENGTDAGCAYLKTKIRQAFPAKPNNNTKEAREQYVLMAEAIFKVLQGAITIGDLKALFSIANNGEIIEKTDFGIIFGKQLRNIVFVLYGYSYNVGKAKNVLKEANKYSGINRLLARQNLENLRAEYELKNQVFRKCIESAKRIITKSDMQFHKKEALVFSGGLLSSIKTIPEYIKYVEHVCLRFIKNQIKEYDQKKEQFPYKEFKPDWSWAETKKTSKSKSSSKPKIEAIPLSYIKRTGGLLIEEADENTVIKKLHFKSLTLGNYVKDDEAREHIRHFVAAIVDLCEVLDINLSINEALAIAFGAFGRGGKAMATYYPTRQLINLTKRNGDGSVAHEWGHFFDHFLNGLELSTKPLRSESCLNTIIESLGYRKKYFIGGKSSPTKDWFKSILKVALEDDVPKTILHQSFAQLIVMLRFGYYGAEGGICVSYDNFNSDGSKKRPTDSYLYHYSKLQGAYWKDIAELFARSFECYVYDKLKAKDRVNNYLVSGGMFSHPVYPQGKERIYINKCFDNLIYAIKKHLSIKSFEPFTDKRADEYIDLTEKGSVNKGVIVGKERKLKLAKIRAKAIRIKQKQLKIS